MQPGVYIIGAGPGDPELLTVKAQRIIAAADLVIWADSLVHPGVAALARPGAHVYASSGLTLEAVTALMVEAVGRGEVVARVHSGDPAIYGAIDEQMALLDAAGVRYEIVPGVSSAFAAAAALQAELTRPGVAQTVVFTRLAQRTPGPDAAALRRLGGPDVTLVLFLSITQAGQVTRELLAAGYGPETPTAVVYRATWEEEKILRCTLGELPEQVRQAGISRQALILVGEALAPRQGAGERSRLYHPAHTHLFRQGAES